MREAVFRGFRSILRFIGRDTRSEFWPFTAAALAIYLILGVPVGFIILITDLAYHPIFSPQTFFQTTHVFFIFSLSMFSLFVALIAAAVARRLHDSGLSAFWGLLPLPPVIISFTLFLRLFSRIGTGEPNLAGC